MATKKKTKTKAKKAKKAGKKAPARKAAPKTKSKKVAAKKAPKAKAKKPKARPKAARKKVQTARPPLAQPVQPAAQSVPAGQPVGVVTHYFNHLSVAIIRLETGSLRDGDVVRIKGHTSDFTQPIESMEVDHAPVSEARAGQSFGLRVKEHAREHDVVYKVAK